MCLAVAVVATRDLVVDDNLDLVFLPKRQRPNVRVVFASTYSIIGVGNALQDPPVVGFIHRRLFGAPLPFALLCVINRSCFVNSGVPLLWRLSIPLDFHAVISAFPALTPALHRDYSDTRFCPERPRAHLVAPERQRPDVRVGFALSYQSNAF